MNEESESIFLLIMETVIWVGRRILIHILVKKNDYDIILFRKMHIILFVEFLVRLQLGFFTLQQGWINVICLTRE